MYLVGVPETKKLGLREEEEEKRRGRHLSVFHGRRKKERAKGKKRETYFILNAAGEKRACYFSRDCAFHYTTPETRRGRIIGAARPSLSGV